MTKVHPFDKETDGIQSIKPAFAKDTTKRAFSSLSKSANSLYKSWKKIQIYNQGMYSLERLEAFKHYYETTSVFHVMLICFVSILPGIGTSIVLEFIDMQPVQEDLSKQTAFWFRVFCMGFIVSIGVTCQTAQLLSIAQVSVLQGFLIAVVTGTLYLCSYIILAIVWTFPTPFGIVFNALSFSAFHIIATMLAIGLHKLKNDRNLRDGLKKQGVNVYFLSCVVVLYAAYSTVFQVLPPTYQPYAILLLPVLKIACKSGFVFAGNWPPESIPEMTTFSVGTYSALFVSVCMQTSSSTLVTVFIISIDALQNLFLVLRLRSNHKLLRKTLKDENRPDLFSKVSKICEDPQLYDLLCAKCIAINSYIKYNPQVIAAVLKSNRTVARSFTMRETKPSENCDEKSGMENKDEDEIVGPKEDELSPAEAILHTDDVSNVSQVLPSEGLDETCQENAKERKSTISNIKAGDDILIEQALKMLFHSEYCVLTEYIEAVVPIIYVAYISILFHLPNAAYYPHSRNMTSDQLHDTAFNLIVYSMLEVLSFIILHFTLKRQFGFSPAYLLAFVLENQALQIQGRFLLCVFFLLQYNLIHYGVDVTFQFNWDQ